LSYKRCQSELELFLEQAAPLLEGPVRPVVLDRRSEAAIEQAAVLDLRHGIGTELPLEAFRAGSFGRCTVAGFERYRAVIDGTTMPLVKVANGFTPQHKDPLHCLWIVPRQHYVRLYRFLRRKLRKEAVENHAAPIMPEHDRHRLFDNTIGFLRREEELLARYGVPLKRGVLLIGEPGNGKTMACRWLMAECQREGLSWKPIDIDGYDRARAMGATDYLFDLEQPGIILFDDFDLGMCHRGDFGPSRDHSTLLSGLGVERRHGVVYVFTSNSRLSELDPAFLRRGRIDVVMHFHKPDAQLRRRLIEDLWHADMRTALDVDRVVRETEGLSFAELDELKKLLLLRFLDAGEWDWPTAKQAFDASERPTTPDRQIGFDAGAHRRGSAFHDTYVE